MLEQTALLTFLGYLSLNLSPSTIRANYTPRYHTQFSDLAARSVGAWFLISTLIRFGCWWTWGDLEAGFRGWYDAMLLTLVVPVWHYSVEKVVWGTPTGRSMVVPYLVDGVGGVWLWWVRGEVLGLGA